MTRISSHFAFHTLLALLAVLWVTSPSHAKTPHFRIMLEDVEAAVSQALNEAQVAEHVSARITSKRDNVLHASYRPVHVEIATLKHDTTKHTWSANMLVKDGTDVVTAMPLAGRYEAQQALPVLTKRVKHGHVISEGNVEMRFFASTKVRSDTVTDPNSIIGKTPRRTIAADRPVRVGELASPTIVEQGTSVNMRYHSPSMQITAMGEALQDGGIGDYIRVRNHDSNKVIRARVLSEYDVAVGDNMMESKR